MGYYQGDGEVSGGDSVVSLRSTGPAVGGAYYTYQRTTSSVTTKYGVSLETARAEQGDMNMNFWQWPGGAVEPACRGTVKHVSHSQINGSNLYMLAITNERIEVRGKQGSYDSGWMS